MPPPQLRNQPSPSGSAYHGPTTPVGESQASFAADVERAIDQDIEGETGAGAELEHAHAALDAVTERDQSHPSKLLEAADSAQQLAPSHRRPIDRRHAVTSA
jgi:hypothetical protein